MCQYRYPKTPQTVSNKDNKKEENKNKLNPMPLNLKRYNGGKNLHFVTFSCYKRRSFLERPEIRDHFLKQLEEDRKNKGVVIQGYVVMPEHIHLLMPEPKEGTISTFLKLTKQKFSRTAHKEGYLQEENPFWQDRFYDFNVTTEKKRIEKLRYIHRNPVKRGLVQNPEDWPWSSYNYYRNQIPSLLTVSMHQ